MYLSKKEMLTVHGGERSLSILTSESVLRAGLMPIRPIAPNWVPRWSYLLSPVQEHTTLQVL